MSAVMVVVAICAGLAMIGFRGRVSTVGVDLGTTFSVIGVSINGKVNIIPDQQGRVIFPSVVSYQGNGGTKKINIQLNLCSSLINNSSFTNNIRYLLEYLMLHSILMIF